MALSRKELYNEVEKAIFHHQAKDVREVIYYLSRKNRNERFDHKRIRDMIDTVATSYRNEKAQ